MPAIFEIYSETGKKLFDLNTYACLRHIKTYVISSNDPSMRNVKVGNSSADYKMFPVTDITPETHFVSQGTVMNGGIILPPPFTDAGYASSYTIDLYGY